MNIADWLWRAARAYPSAPAVGLGERDLLNYDELARRAASLSSALSERHGLCVGDRVALVAENHPSYVEALLGIWWAGLVAVPVNPKLHPTEVAWILGNCRASVVLVSEKLEPLIGGLDLDGAPVYAFGDHEYERLLDGTLGPPRRCGDDALAWLFYTSGTTGRPKGAMLTHGNLSAMTLGFLADVANPTAGDAILHAAPMSHGSGLYLMSHVCRVGVNVVAESGGFDAHEVLAAATARGGVTMFAAPTMINRIVAAVDAGTPGDGRFRTLVWGGAPMYAGDVARSVEALGPCLAQIYGQGESPMTITVLSQHDVAEREHPRWLKRLGSAGLPNSVVDVRLATGGGEHAEPDTHGEVEVRGATVMAGYWENAPATEQALRDGWLRTGDVGSFDDEGYLTLRDRIKDVVISGGSNVYPREVEEVLLAHPGVREAAVIGRPDPEWGEVVVAYVVGEATPTELDAACLDQIARFKRPRAYITLPELPKTTTGKVLRAELRELDRIRTS